MRRRGWRPRDDRHRRRGAARPTLGQGIAAMDGAHRRGRFEHQQNDAGRFARKRVELDIRVGRHHLGSAGALSLPIRYFSDDIYAAPSRQEFPEPRASTGESRRTGAIPELGFVRTTREARSRRRRRSGVARHGRGVPGRSKSPGQHGVRWPGDGAGDQDGRGRPVVLDLRLGNEDGLEIVRSLRAESDLPIIVLTGQRREEVDRVVGLELGADDYLTKPFSPRELLARIRAVLRRSELQARRPAPDGKRARYRFAGWELSLRTRRLTSPSGDVVPPDQGRVRAPGGPAAVAAAGAEPGATARRPAGCTTTRSSTEASTCRSCGCAARSRSTPPLPS